MKKVHILLKSSILGIIDFFYPPFKRVFTLQIFRYLACGGTNTLLDIVLFSISYNWVFDKQNVQIGPITLSPHIAAFILAFLVTFPVGFYLSRYVVFQHSELRGRTQLSRYLLVVSGCILINYVLLKTFIEYLGWFPTPAKIITTMIVVVFSYLTQTYFSFTTSRKVKV